MAWTLVTLAFSCSVALSSTVIIPQSTQPEEKEYCQWEKFNATCKPNEVILMLTARYGRMKLGRCLTTDYFVGCSADVLSHMDTRCSGRQSCIITIPDPTLFNVQPCRKDLVAYFSASYSCMPVQGGEGQRCLGKASASLPPAGYLASYMTELTGHGAAHCPWRIQVSPGQRINVSLYDFSTWPLPGSKDGGEDNAISAKACTIVGMVREHEHTTEIRSCYGYQRITHALTSHSNKIEIEIINPSVLRRRVYFLLKYEATGCPNLRAPKTVTIKRKGEIAIVRCNDTTKSWHLVCKGTDWMGEIGNCTEGAESNWQSGRLLDIPDHIPYGIMIAIAIGAVLGVMLGIVFLLMVLFYQKRRRRLRRPEPRPGEAVHIALESHYGEHPEVAYKLMELRDTNISLNTGSSHSDEILGMTTFKKPNRLGDYIYERPTMDLGIGKMDPVRTCTEGDPNCLGCSHEKEKCYLFDLVRAPTPVPKTYNTSSEVPVLETTEQSHPQSTQSEIVTR